MKTRARIVAISALAALGVVGLAQLTAAATLFNVDSNASMSAFLINGQSNPTLTLTRGQTYTFHVLIPAHPFWITTAFGSSEAETNQFSTGVAGNGNSPGDVVFTVPASAPPTLFYQCKFHETMQGTLNIVAAPTVPSLGLWSAVGLATLLMLVAAVVLRRRARA